MADYTELKRLAEASLGEWYEIGELRCEDRSGYINGLHHDDEYFIAAANPAAVLALIAENEELGRYLSTCRDCGGEGALHTGDWHSYGHMEPPEPVMEKCGECDGTGLLGEIQDLYQVITERDQLRAEVAGLRTGYEAYERVNAELKAENEALRAKLECPDPILIQSLDSAIADYEQLEKNATRYQWLREARRGYIEVVEWIGPHATGMTGEDLDALLDAAMGKGEQS
ncbi:hypothetical protein NM213_04955 [Pseudomonas lactis]|uniref:hypothetical protein n=1 Tax=Pseudomonas lactis TaxID=1615674 RepID=UPI001F376464|nr:hypothetical protein [Pseudomonas lactis]MDR8369261.1 hypothetical protein [Pseudomonas lactis]